MKDKGNNLKEEMEERQPKIILKQETFFL